MNGKVTVLPVLLLAGVTAACDDAEFEMFGGKVEAPFHFSFDVKPGGRLEVESFNGSISIRGWNENKIEVDGTRFAYTEAERDAIRIEKDQNSAGVTLRAIRPPSHHGGGKGVKFVLRVPQTFELDRIVTSNASVQIEDVQGAVRARTSNGSVSLSHIAGLVNANTSNSSINLTGLNGNAVLETSNGHIGADHVNGQVDATSSNGSIEINFENSPKSSIHASTSNSGITIRMPSASAARVRASTSNSGIETDFQVDSPGAPSKNHLEGAINGGGPMLELSTSNGSIKILKP